MTQPLTPSFNSYEEYLRADELRQGIIRINQSIDDDTTSIWLSELARLRHDPDVSQVTLLIMSPGGGAYYALALYDVLRAISAEGKPVRAIVEGMAASAAAMIVLQAADERMALPHARFLLHEARRWVFAALERASDMEDEVTEMRALTDQITEILARRCKKAPEDVRALIERREVWFSANEALTWGLVDRVLA